MIEDSESDCIFCGSNILHVFTRLNICLIRKYPEPKNLWQDQRIMYSFEELCSICANTQNKNIQYRKLGNLKSWLRISNLINEYTINQMENLNVGINNTNTDSLNMISANDKLWEAKIEIEKLNLELIERYILRSEESYLQEQDEIMRESKKSS